MRGKQFELILLRENAELISKNNISPIIEPVKNNFSSLIKAAKELNKVKADFTLIVNPQVGQSDRDDIISDLIDREFKHYRSLSIGYILHPDTRQSRLISLLDRFPDRVFSLIHNGFMNGQSLSDAISDHNNIKTHIFLETNPSKLYRKHFKKLNSQRVLIRNGFKQREKNSLYPPDEHFSDLHITHDDEGMDGFGDFLITGDKYSETGGPAYSVAIHLTHLGMDNDMFIFHFLSDHNDSPADPGGKFLEAMVKLVKEVRKEPKTVFQSKAVKEFESLYEKQHFPGLGYVKKLSMQHHIELMANFLNGD